MFFILKTTFHELGTWTIITGMLLLWATSTEVLFPIRDQVRKGLSPMMNARVGSMRVCGSLKLTATQVASPITAEYLGENPLSISAVITTRGMV